MKKIVYYVGTEEERGLLAFREVKNGNLKQTSDGITDQNPDNDTLYDIPIISKYIRKIYLFRYIPFLPSYQEPELNCSRKQKNIETRI